MKKINSIFKVFVLLAALFVGGNVSVWAADNLFGKTAVAIGEGKAKVTVKYGNSTKSAEAEDSTEKTVSCEVKSGTNWLGLGKVEGQCIFTATPATGYKFAGWYSDVDCTKDYDAGSGTNNELKLPSNPTTSGGRYTRYAKFVEDTPPVFYFSASAKSYNASQGSASASWEHDTVRADYGVSSVADTVIFTATPRPGYRFKEWKYEDVFPADNIRYSNPCTVRIVNNKAFDDVSRNYTAYFVAKKSQSILWRAGVKTNVSVEGGAVDLSSAVSVTPDNRSYQLSFISSNTSVLRVEGTTIVPVAQGEANVYACVIEDDEYAADTTDVALTFTVSARATPLFTVDSEYNLKVGDSFEVLSDNHSNVALIQCASESSSDIYSFTSTTTAEHGVGTVTALKEGSVRLKFSQPATDGWNGGSTDWITVNISRHTTDLTVNTTEKTLLIDETYDPEVTTNNTDVTLEVSSSAPSVAIYEDGVIKALTAGSAILTFAQSQTTEKWTSAITTINVTVEKHNPNLHVTNIPAANWNTTITPVFETENTESPVVLTQLSGGMSAKLIDGKIVVYNVVPDVAPRFRATQEATDYYAAAQYDFAVVVAHPSNHVTYHVLSNFTIGNTGSNTNSVKYSDVIHYTGIARNVTFEYACSNRNSSGVTWRVEESADGSSWTNAVWSSTSTGTSYKNADVILKPSSQYIRFMYSGNYAGYVRNVVIHERSEVIANNKVANRDFGTFEVGATATAVNIPLSWYSVPELTITSSNPSVFEVTTPTITAGIDVFDENAKIGITYHHNTVSPAEGDKATITIASVNGFINQTFTVSGKTVKKNQTLTWADGISPMTVGNEHNNPATATLPLNYEVTSGTAVEIVDGTKIIRAVAAGEATVRAYNGGDDTWNPIESTYTFSVTELKVLRIHWAQTFSRLLTSSADIEMNAEVFVVKEDTEEKVDRPITYTSSNPDVVTIVDGNYLHVEGAGTASVTAHVDGDKEYLEDNLARTITVRAPSEGCEMFVLENASDKLFTVDDAELALSGDPAAITFDAWSSRWGIFSPSSSPMKLAEYYNETWHDIWEDELKVDEQQTFGPIALHRNTTKLKFYTETGATCYHSFSSAFVTMAKYLEFVDSPDATATNVYFPVAETQIGQTYIKTVGLRYSYIHDQLTVTHTNSKFVVTPATIGEQCGDHGVATISIQFYAESEGTEEDVITITDGESTRTIRVSATTQRNNQTITFTPAESILTTDNVTLSASATSTLPVSFELVSGEDYATVNSTGVISVLQGGGSIVVRATQEGNTLYNAAPSVDKTININKVIPTIATAPTVVDVTLPATLAAAAIDGASAVVVDDKGTSVDGSFAWADATTALVAGTNTYAAVFTPTNTNFYTTATCDLSVTASKLSQTIDWSLVEGSSYHYFQPVTLDATATSGLPITYTSSDEFVANIVAGAVHFIAPGEVTLTASQAGNETYEAAEPVARTISIVKATPVVTTTPSLVTFYLGHSLSESPILGGIATVDGHVVDGNFSWKADATPTAIGYYYFPAIFTPNNTTFFDAAECDVEVRVTPYDRVFTDETGNHRWSDTRNWESGFVPTVSVDVTIADTLIIDCEAIVGELTIEENAAVLVIENGSLTVDHSGTSSTGVYGDLYVQDAASVTFNGDFQLRDLYLSSLLDSPAGHSKSAQVSNPDNLRIGGDVYFDLKIDASGTCSPGWYDFTVPFPVDALNGVYRIENGVVRKVTNEVNYAIMSYSEAVRAEGKYGWKKFRGIMQPGVCYSMTIDDVYPVYRFKKTATGALNTETTMAMTYTVGEGGATNQGWNCLGNGTLRHADLSADGINKVQVYNHASNSYSVVSMNECSFVVGAAFFVQAVSNQSLMTLNSASHSVLRAPAAAPAYSDEHCLVLTRENSASVLDRLYLSATEESKSSYLPGHDLAKFETSASTPQMWCAAFGAKLCDAELALTSNKVDFPLTISTPSAATYTLSLSKTVQSETLYLVRDGAIVWNLSLSDYTFDLPKGTDTSYSIRLVRDAYSTPTGINYLEQHSANKCLIDGVLYILRDGRMFDVEGRLVK